ncbi:hypothetical protein Dsin_022127 [Dipteronia sinensis]|uniref:Uncharacterized protein n=1 Tax=Dipteronia sinensis TaxID=43782 RepID=A0AAE0A1W4_9ROSI|nr:hypothetical protein Dsin_022127 [Dipteronia sinensis]
MTYLHIRLSNKTYIYIYIYSEDSLYVMNFSWQVQIKPLFFFSEVSFHVMNSSWHVGGSLLHDIIISAGLSHVCTCHFGCFVCMTLSHIRLSNKTSIFWQKFHIL